LDKPKDFEKCRVGKNSRCLNIVEMGSLIFFISSFLLSFW